ncbi:MAG: phosphoribosylformylglycinamidine cyclo-ligase [Pseudomonadaceae bacterium]|nr:phosphoribosylformylglycinamidine cyclo-ligase [Pseudomonadaceae bacterium]
MTSKLTYKDAGVDIDAGAELVRRISGAVKATHRPEVRSDLGGFAALTELPTRYRHPMLVTGTDGVGTKLRLAIDYDRHDSIGQDLVAMCVNDVLVTGAEPLLFLDYYATASLDVDVAARVIAGIADGCQLAGCALVGGETAEMPGMYESGDYDLAGFCVGVVERDQVISGANMAPGNALIGLASSGAHSNGYSLIRRVLENAGRPSDALLDELLAPTRIYVALVQQILAEFGHEAVHAMAHVTGGGFQENLPRMLRSDSLALRVTMDSWQRPDLFSWLQQAGNIDELEMLKTFNCGIGFVLCVDDAIAEPLLAWLAAQDERAWQIGEVVSAGAQAADGELVLSSAD